MSQDEPIENSAIDDQTQNNYRIWKKNTPFLYDYVSTTSLLWPSLTVSFFPDLETPTNDISYQRLLLGTFTLGQSTDSISILQLPLYTNLKSKLNNVEKLNYTDKEEFELNTVPKLKIKNLQKINHLGDVNKSKYMIQNPDIIATSNNFGDLIVYDRTKHPNSKDDINKPEIRLETGSSVDIYAFDWNKQRESVILSADINGTINEYNIKSQLESKNQNTINSINQYQNVSGVNDIEWSPIHGFIFAYVDEKGYLKINDTRQKSGDNCIVKKFQVNSDNTPINALSFGSSNYIATGDSTGKVAIIDLRNGPLDKWKCFNGSITQIKWHHKFGNVFGASSTDKTVKLFDLATEDREIFVHGGHMLGVNDFDWSLHDDWLLASVSDDNSLHVWKPSSMNR